MKCTFPLALTFLTKAPWPRRPPAASGDLASFLFWFPWVGAVLGLIFLGAWLGLSRVLPLPAAAGLLLGLSVWITGGLHLDGLADTMDGLGGGRTPEQRLRLMKDSRVGAFGVMSLVLVLLLKFACFLAAGQQGWRAEFILFPLLSRWGMVFLAYLSPYARPEGGLGEAMTTVSRRTAAGAGVLIWLLSRYFKKTLGGVTGDVLGAANEVVEVAVLVGALLFS